MNRSNYEIIRELPEGQREVVGAADNLKEARARRDALLDETTLQGKANRNRRICYFILHFGPDRRGYVTEDDPVWVRQ